MSDEICSNVNEERISETDGSEISFLSHKSIEAEVVQDEKYDNDDDKDESNEMSDAQRIMVLCNCLLVSIHRITVSSFYLVIPYYVLSTPQNGWTSHDLAVIFGLFCAGNIVGSQSTSITSLVISNSSIGLFIAHSLELTSGIIGWFLVRHDPV